LVRQLLEAAAARAGRNPDFLATVRVRRRLARKFRFENRDAKATGRAMLRTKSKGLGGHGNDSIGVYDYGADFFEVYENGARHYYSKVFDVTGGDVIFFGLNGDDYFENATNLRTRASGGYGIDCLYGGSNDDVLMGNHDMDVLCGRGGNDRIEAGDDYTINYLYGGDGDDYLFGARVTDYIFGGNGMDVIYGRSGNDYLYGNAGNDFLYGEAGNDQLDGGDDGVVDYLNWGVGADRFQREWVYYYALTRGQTGYWNDREYVADYAWWEGDYFYDNG
jgi:Ca2+-binding RTX toxin-like protein